MSELKNYKVVIDGFSDKVYRDTTIDNIMSEVVLFTNLWNIESITSIKSKTSYITVLDFGTGKTTQYKVWDVDSFDVEEYLDLQGHKVEDLHWLITTCNRINLEY
tara:strand:- start:1360 stop:1674 length:315 start_codon:yes stop_codon:yes gene_type:complete